MFGEQQDAEESRAAEVDARLFDRIRDLQASLAGDLEFLIRVAEEDAQRPDALRDLGERLADLGGALLHRSDEVNAAILATLPPHGWLPGVGARRHATVLAHQVGPRPLRHGSVDLALCGAPCIPFYGRDTTDRTARHVHCPTCLEPCRGLL